MFTLIIDEQPIDEETGTSINEDLGDGIAPIDVPVGGEDVPPPLPTPHKRFHIIQTPKDQIMLKRIYPSYSIDFLQKILKLDPHLTFSTVLLRILS